MRDKYDNEVHESDQGTLPFNNTRLCGWLMDESESRLGTRLFFRKQAKVGEVSSPFICGKLLIKEKEFIPKYEMPHNKKFHHLHCLCEEHRDLYHDAVEKQIFGNKDANNQSNLSKEVILSEDAEVSATTKVAAAPKKRGY